jgi:hypothetical protein
MRSVSVVCEKIVCIACSMVVSAPNKFGLRRYYETYVKMHLHPLNVDMKLKLFDHLMQ